MVFEVTDNFIVIHLASGRRLSARLWLPTGTGPVPAIVDANPYRAWDLSRASQEAVYGYWAAHGYACLCVDTMGSGNSEGVLRDEYLPEEIADAVDVVAWCAAQDWCDGCVGMHGFSWAAFVALRAAAQRPPALKALVLGGVSEDGWRTDIHHLGGVPYVGQADWAATMLMFNALPPDPAIVGEDRWLTLWRTRLDANRPFLERWMAHPTRDGYWQAKAATLVPDETTLPLLLYCGTADKYAASVLRIARQWTGPCKTILGPWDHRLPDFSSRAPQIGFLDEALRWWDRWLKGAGTNADNEADLRVWVGAADCHGQTTQGQWFSTGLSHAAPFVLLPCGEALMAIDEATQSCCAELQPRLTTPGAIPADLYEDVPAPIDLNASAGTFLSIATAFNEDEIFFGSPILTFQTHDDDGQVVARLCDMAPDGRAVRMTTGATTLASGPNAIILQPVAWQLKRGHRIVLLLSADAWPTLWPPDSSASVSISDMQLALPLAALRGSTLHFATPQEAAHPAISPLKWIDPDDHNIAGSRIRDAATSSRHMIANHLDEVGNDYFISKLLAIGKGECEILWRVMLGRPGWFIALELGLHVRRAPGAFELTWNILAKMDENEIHKHAETLRIPG